VSPKQAQLMYQGKGKDTSFIPPGGGRAAEAFHSLFSHIDGKIRSHFNLASRAIRKAQFAQKRVAYKRLLFETTPQSFQIY
jgi:hypothetical protein